MEFVLVLSSVARSTLVLSPVLFNPEVDGVLFSPYCLQDFHFEQHKGVENFSPSSVGSLGGHRTHPIPPGWGFFPLPSLGLISSPPSTMVNEHLTFSEKTAWRFPV